MPRNAPAVVIGCPHHITQHGNNREPVLLNEQNRRISTDLVKHDTQKYLGLISGRLARGRTLSICFENGTLENKSLGT
jgi:REP element-mobilizing transposase RayT